MIETNDWLSKTNDPCMYENSVTRSRCCTTGALVLRNLTLIHLERSRHSVNTVAERAEVDEDDDTEANNWIVALVLNQY